jgi:hypothetical protein
LGIDPPFEVDQAARVAIEDMVRGVAGRSDPSAETGLGGKNTEDAKVQFMNSARK